MYAFYIVSFDLRIIVQSFIRQIYSAVNVHLTASTLTVQVYTDSIKYVLHSFCLLSLKMTYNKITFLSSFWALNVNRSESFMFDISSARTCNFIRSMQL